MSEIAIITREEVERFTKIGMTTDQINILIAPTPKKYIKERQGKGGQKWSYVTGGHVNKVLNLAFGWDWDFEILDYKFDVQIGQAFVHGRLTVRIKNDGVVTEIKKEQFGRVDIKFFKGTKDPVDLGNDLKAASTDAMKKCASLIGVASDIYNKEDYAPSRVVDEKPDPILARLSNFLSKATSLEELEKIWFEFTKNHAPEPKHLDVYNHNLNRFQNEE